MPGFRSLSGIGVLLTMCHMREVSRRLSFGTMSWSAPTSFKFLSRSASRAKYSSLKRCCHLSCSEVASEARTESWGLSARTFLPSPANSSSSLSKREWKMRGRVVARGDPSMASMIWKSSSSRPMSLSWMLTIFNDSRTTFVISNSTSELHSRSLRF